MSFLRPSLVCRVAFLLMGIVGASFSVGAQTVIRVPSEAASLQDALARVPDGGTVELATGTYNAPRAGYANPAGKAFTVQSASGASVTITGAGGTDLLRLTHNRDRGKPATFAGITFVDGVSDENFIGGAATVASAEVIFKNCAFLNHRARGNVTAGGAFFINNSVVSFIGCTFSGNFDRHGGGAISALDSTVYVTNCRFTGNRSDGPGHDPRSPGGAIYTYHTILKVSGSVFQDNHAGYVGGAIYGAAAWDQSEQLIEIKNSLFYANTALKDASVSFSEPSVGGAVHVEENSTLRISHCNFTENESSQAGAVSTFRSLVDIDHSFFKGNKALPLGTRGEGVGGAILALSGGGGEPVNRRSIVLNVSDSVFTGTADGSPVAKQGGQIFVGGDPNAAYGLSGVPQNGTVESNRAQLKLQRVTFFESRINSSDVPARGSAVMGDFAHIEADGVLFLKGDAGSGSGALEAVNDCVVNVNNSAFQQNTASVYGAAITHLGGELNVTNTKFLDNTYQPQDSGQGVDIVTFRNSGGSNGAGTNMTGLVSNCLFSGRGAGGRIYEGAGFQKPYNLLQYSGNQFMPEKDAYVSDILRVTTVAGLNAFSVNLPDGLTVKKAPTPNTALGALPEVANFLTYSVTAPRVGAAGAAPVTSSFIAFAATGNCVVDGAQQASADLIEATVGTHTLTVGKQSYTTAAEKNTPVNISTRLQVGSGSDALIAGFIIQGRTPKKVAVRGIGPSLTRVGLSGALVDTSIALYNQGGGLAALNDDWQSSDSRMELASVGLAPAEAKESALIATLLPGSYTVVMQGAGGATGIGLVEVYDLDGGRVSKLANISTRGVVRSGDRVMIGGFILQGENGATNAVVRGIGPSLTKAGVNGALGDAVLELYNANGQVIAQNDNWSDGPDAAFMTSNSLAPSDPRESALLLRNAGRGTYTAILRGKNGTSGICLVEAYVF